MSLLPRITFSCLQPPVVSTGGGEQHKTINYSAGGDYVLISVTRDTCDGCHVLWRGVVTSLHCSSYRGRSPPASSRHRALSLLTISHPSHIIKEVVCKRRSGFVLDKPINNNQLEKLEAAKAAWLVCLRLLSLTGSFLVLLGPPGPFWASGLYLALFSLT